LFLKNELINNLSIIYIDLLLVIENIVIDIFYSDDHTIRFFIVKYKEF